MSEKIFISSFKRISDRKPVDIGLDDFLRGVREGDWQDDVLHIRTISEKKERQREKEKCPNVRISGSFTSYSDKDLRKHSGFIAIDIDGTTDPESVKELVSSDPYVYAAFISISGNGVCLLFKIDATRHSDSFEAIASYLYEAYSLIVDQSGKNVSRARYVSYDPGLIENSGALTFKKYPPKRKPSPQNKILFVQSDFDEIINQLYSRGVNLCESYPEWVSVAYALISQYNEAGREYFHTLASLSSKYSHGDSERQYDNCLKSHASGGKERVATIGTIYHHAKHAGIDIYSPRTREIIRAATSQSKAGIKAHEIASYLAKFQDVPIEEGLPLVQAALDAGVSVADGSLIDEIQSYLGRYELRRNTITRNIERTSAPIDDTELNSIYCDLRSINDKITKDLVLSVIYSNRTNSYNPIREFYDLNRDTPIQGELKKLCASIITDTEHASTFITKWLVSIIASIHGTHSPLALVLTGGIRKGKTEWFRRLLPRALKHLYSEEKLRDNKDAMILLTKKLLCMDDEWDGMSKSEDTFFKALMSKDWFSIREPYGRISVDLKRLAVICGTSNTAEIILDPERNRRILPIDVQSIDFTLYNAVNKNALFIEIWQLWESGYEWEMSFADIEALLSSSERHNIISSEAELLHAYFTKPTSTVFAKKLTNSEILAYLKRETGAVLSAKRLGNVLKGSGFEQVRVKKNGETQRMYYVDFTNPVEGALPH